MRIFVRMRRFLLTLGTIDILCFVYSHFCANEIIFRVCKQSFTEPKYYCGTEIQIKTNKIKKLSNVNRNRRIRTKKPLLPHR